MTRPRDSQRAKVWNALRSVEQGRTLKTWAEVNSYLSIVVKSPWWTKHAPPQWTGVDWEAVFEDWGRPAPPVTELMVLRRLAHRVQPEDTAWHGVEWVKIFLSLVQRFMGMPKRTVVAAAFRAHGVKMTQWSPEAREAAKRRSAEKELLAMMKALGGSEGGR